MNYKKAKILYLLLAFFISVNKNSVYAADSDVICGDMGCSGFDNSLFSDVDVLPGDSSEKTVSIKNTRGNPLSIYLSGTKDEGNDDVFSDQLIFSVEKGGVYSYKDTLSSFFVSDDVFLTQLPAGGEEEFTLALNFDKSLGNEYQEKTAKFSLSLTAEEDEGESQNSPTPTPDVNNSSDDNDTTDVLSQATSGIGEVLGLSDTSSLYLISFFESLGILFILISLYYFYTSRQGKNDSKR
jgi:hypothetical protein